MFAHLFTIDCLNGRPKPSYDFTSKTPGAVTLPSWLTLQRLSPAALQTSASTVVLLNSNQAGVYSDGTIKGLLQEEKRANYINNSDTTTSWATGPSATVTHAQTDPTGGTKAATYVQTTAGSYAGVISGTGSIANAAAFKPFTLSAWLKSTASYVSLAMDCDVKNQHISSAGTSGVWQKKAFTSTSTVSIVGLSPIISECRSTYNDQFNGATSGTLAFPQFETGSYATSYIATTGSGGTTRQSSVLIAQITSATYFNISITNQKVSTLANCTDDPYIIGNYEGDQTFAIWTDEITGYVKIQNASEIITTALQCNWVAADVMTSNISVSGTTVNITILKNGVSCGSASATLSAPINIASKKLIIGSDYLGAHSYAGYLQRISGTFNGDIYGGWTAYLDFGLGSSGTITLPTGFSFTCASTRTCAASSSTLIRGVGANIACKNYQGLQHEDESTNYNQYSEAFNLGTTIGTSGGSLTAITDPAGFSTAMDALGATGVGGGVYIGGGSIAQTGTKFALSSWVKGTDGTSRTACGLSTITVTTITSFTEEAPQSTTWHRNSSIYVGASTTSNYIVFIDSRIPCDTPKRGGFAFVQLEKQGYISSYIPTSGTSATRARSALYYTTTTNDWSGSVKFVASATPANANTPYITVFSASDRSMWIGLEDSTGFKIRTQMGAAHFGTQAITWAVGDVVQFDCAISGAVSTINIYVNSVLVATDTFTNSSAWTYPAAKNLYIGCSALTGGYIPTSAYKHIKIKG
jgi:hypothetical protein